MSDDRGFQKGDRATVVNGPDSDWKRRDSAHLVGLEVQVIERQYTGDATVKVRLPEGAWPVRDVYLPVANLKLIED